MHTLWACPGLTGDVVVADADVEGVTLTNLNRGVLFTRADINTSKAHAAATAAAGSIRWEAHQGRFEEVESAPEILVSAVDTNRSRSALQDRYPARILSGSTRDLRAEVLRVGPPGVGACLRCYDVPEPAMPDAEVRRRALDPADGGSTINLLAAEGGLTPGEMTAMLGRPVCDEVGERTLRRLREMLDTDVPQFSVGFTSLTAGILLAAETVKTLLPVVDTEASSDEFLPNDLTIQFWRPAAPNNGLTRLGRDRECTACVPDSVRLRVWSSRYERWRTG
jgi:molybdopterin/thiamine biosynthesis adenylyltransferase